MYNNLIRFCVSFFRENPKITVGISSYNHSQYLKQCIDSVLNQKYKNFDIIIIDDCSKDKRNQKILRKYEKNPKITIIYKEKNEGISSSLNDQIANMKGDWLAFVDCDDFLPDNALKEMSKCIKKNPKYRLIYSNRIEVGEDGKEIRKLYFGHRMKKGIFEELLKGMTSSHLKIIHKDVFDKVGIFYSKFDGVQDYDMYLRIAFYMPETLGFINKFLYYHRIHNNQYTIAKANIHKKNVDMVINNAKFRKKMSKLCNRDNFDFKKNICGF